MIADGTNCANEDCKHGEGYHTGDWPRVCKIHDCKCLNFTPDSFLPPSFFKYLNELPQGKKKVRYLLDNIQYLRNENNEFFVLDYLIFTVGMQDRIILNILRALRSRIRYLQSRKIHVPDWESIRRAKQLLVAENPEKYGPFDPKVIAEKELKQSAIEEFLTEVAA